MGTAKTGLGTSTAYVFIVCLRPCAIYFIIISTNRFSASAFSASTLAVSGADFFKDSLDYYLVS